jgi:hypothetical protein
MEWFVDYVLKPLARAALRLIGQAAVRAPPGVIGLSTGTGMLIGGLPLLLSDRPGGPPGAEPNLGGALICPVLGAVTGFAFSAGGASSMMTERGTHGSVGRERRHDRITAHRRSR